MPCANFVPRVRVAKPCASPFAPVRTEHARWRKYSKTWLPTWRVSHRTCKYKPLPRTSASATRSHSSTSGRAQPRATQTPRVQNGPTHLQWEIILPRVETEDRSAKVSHPRGNYVTQPRSAKDANHRPRGENAYLQFGPTAS